MQKWVSKKREENRGKAGIDGRLRVLDQKFLVCKNGIKSRVETINVSTLFGAFLSLQ